MKKAPIPKNEEARLKALLDYKVLDTEPEHSFDQLTKLAATICGTEIALVSLVDSDRQWFKSRYGLDMTETPRDISFCGHAIESDEAFIVEDSDEDKRFCDNPLVTGLPRAKFYAGVPLTTPEGERIGALCVIDSSPKKIDESQVAALKTLASHVIDLLELRKKNLDLEKMKSQYSDVQQISKTGGWELFLDTGETRWSDEIYRIHRVPLDTPTNKVDGISFYAEHERPRLLKYIEECASEGIAFNDVFEFYDSDGKKKFVRSRGRAVRNKSGEIFKLVGTFQDVSEFKRKQFRDRNISEIRHRYIKESNNPEKFFKFLLEKILEVGESEYGFIGEVKEEVDKESYQMYAISDLTNLSGGKEFYKKNIDTEFVFHDLDNVFGAAIKQKKCIFSNEQKHEKYNGLPAEHPELENFLGIPLINLNGKVIGILGLGNRKKGYSERFLNFLSPLIESLSEMAGMFKILRESKRKAEEHQYILNNMKIGTWSWDIERNILDWDDSNYLVYGINKRDFSGAFEAWEQTLHPDGKEEAVENLNRALEGDGDFEATFVIKYKDNEKKYIGAKAKINRDKNGKAISMFGVNWDKTEIHYNEQEMRKQERFFKDTVDILPALFCAKSVDGGYLHVNKAFLELHGLEEDKVLGKTAEEVMSDSFDADLQNLEVIMSDGVTEVEEKIVDVDGTTHHLHSFRFPYKNEKGQVYATGSISLDVTEKKEVEKQLHHSTRLASIGQLAAGVGHEINNPLAIIKGYLSIMQNKEGEELSVSRELVTKLDLATDRIANIVKGLRTFARSDESSDQESFKVYDVVKESINLVNEIYRQEGVELKFDFSAGAVDLSLDGDRGHFQQLLVNLISNAKDASEGKKERLVQVELDKADDNLLALRVIDNGKGIPREEHEKIFDPFFTTKEVGQGTGIGLSLVHKFVKELDGQINLDSKVDEGTSFEIILPAQELPLNFNQKAAEKELTRKFDLNILLVDDEEGIREILEDILTDAGASVTTASNGQEAIDIFSDNPFGYELVISDMKMPVKDGITFLKELREKEGVFQPKFIFITGGINVDFESKDNPINQMIDGYFLKPFKDEDILEELNRIFIAKAS